MVYEKDNILLKKGYGYANEQYKIMNTIDTKYKIGSYTKQFTAVAILKLYENGELGRRYNNTSSSFPHFWGT